MSINKFKFNCINDENGRINTQFALNITKTFLDFNLIRAGGVYVLNPD